MISILYHKNLFEQFIINFGFYLVFFILFYVVVLLKITILKNKKKNY